MATRRSVLVAMAALVVASLVACTKPPAGDPLVPYDSFAPADGTTPWIQTLLDLPVCRDRAGLDAWVTERLPGLASAGPAARRPLATVVAHTPVLLRPPRSVACAVGASRGDALAWEMQDVQGRPVARAATYPSALAEDRWGNVAGDIFQDVIATGQSLSAVTTDTRMAGRLRNAPTDERLFVTDFPYDGPPKDGDRPWPGRWLAGKFGLSRWASPDHHHASPAPRLLPSGFVRCAGPVDAHANPLDGRRTTFCNGKGELIAVQNWAPRPPYAVLPSSEFASVDMVQTVETKGRRRVLTGPTPQGTITVDVPDRFDEATLRRIAGTIVALDRRAWQVPAADRLDLRDRFTVGWFRDALLAGGGRDVLADEADNTVEGGMGLGCAGGGPCEHPKPLPIEVNLTLPDGHRVEGHASIERAEPQATPPHGLTEIRTLADHGVDIRIYESSSSNRVEFRCGWVRVSLRTLGIGRGTPPGPVRPIADYATALVPALGC